MVTTADGKTYLYDKLVLATGAKPIVPPISGTSLPGVFTLRTTGDAVNILHWMNSRRVRNAVLIGAGAIGVEIAYLTAQHGVNVTLVEMFDHIMQKALDPDMSEMVEMYMKEKRVDLLLSKQVEAIAGKDQVEGLVLSSNEELNAEMVIISVGAQPNSELAEKVYGMLH